MRDSELARIEGNAFRDVVDTGLADVMAAGLVAVLALAPLLSVYLGDFWASAVFLPAWAAIFLGLREFHQRWVRPRVGTVRFLPERRRRTRWLLAVLVAVNGLAALAGGAVLVLGGRGQLMGVLIALALLLACSAAAYSLGIPRYLGYGLLLAAAPFVGEVLFRTGHASHHGYPLAFGVAALAILLGGVVRLGSRLTAPPPALEGPGGDPDGG